MNDLTKAQQFQDHFHLHFNNTSLLIKALQARGITDPDGNKRLAHIGDSLLELSLRIAGLERGLGPGRVTQTINNTVINKNLSARGQKLGIDRFIRCNPSQKNDISKGLRADTMEAIIGAYFEDQGRTFGALMGVVEALGLGWPE